MATSLDQISLIFVFGSLGYLLGSLFSGQAYDRFSNKRVIAITLFVISVCAGLIPFMHNLLMLLLVMVVLGIAKGALDVGCNTLLQWLHRKNAGPFMNGLHFFFGLGAFCAPLILAGVLLLTGAIYWMFWLFSALSLPLAIWLWNLPGPAAENAARESGQAQFPVVPVMLLVLAFLLYVGAEIGFGNWIYTYSFTLGLTTELTSAYLTSAFWGAFTLGRMLGIWISAHARESSILFVDLAGCLASIGVILLWQESTAALWAGTIGLGLSMASIFPTLLLLAGKRLHVSGAITSWFLVGASIGGMSLPWGIGQVFVRMGAVAMPAIVLVTMTFTLLVMVVFLNRSAAKTIAD